MDPFLVDDILSCTHYVGIEDEHGKPRKIKNAELNVLLHLARNQKCELDLAVSFRCGALRDKDTYYRANNESRLRKIFEREVELSISKLSKCCSMSYLTTWRVVKWLIKNGVIDRIGFRINRGRFISM